MSRIVKWVSGKIRVFVYSKFFVFVLGGCIFGSSVICWYEGKAFASDYLGFNSHGIVVSAEVQVTPQGESIGNADGDTAETPSLEEIVSKGTFTAYTASESETDSNPEIMASGKKVYKGAIACPDKYKFGTKITVENMGTFVCEDRMAARFRNREYFDILMSDYSEAMQFGRRELSFEVSA